MSRHREKIAARVRPTDLVMCNDRRIIRPDEAIARSIEPRSFSFGYMDLGKSRLIGLWLPANRRGFIDAPPRSEIMRVRLMPVVLPADGDSPPPLIRFSLSLSLSLSLVVHNRYDNANRAVAPRATGRLYRRKEAKGRGQGEGRIKVMRQCAGSPHRAR